MCYTTAVLFFHLTAKSPFPGSTTKFSELKLILEHYGDDDISVARQWDELSSGERDRDRERERERQR